MPKINLTKLKNKAKCKQKHLYRFIRNLFRSRWPAYVSRAEFDDSSVEFREIGYDGGFENGVRSRELISLSVPPGIMAVHIPERWVGIIGDVEDTKVEETKQVLEV